MNKATYLTLTEISSYLHLTRDETAEVLAEMFFACLLVQSDGQVVYKLTDEDKQDMLRYTAFYIKDKKLKVLKKA